MLAVFLIGSTPPEHIHDLFAHHQDDIDPPVRKGQSVMTPQHHHCSFLGFVFGPFVTNETEYLFFEHITHASSWLESCYAFSHSAIQDVVSLRGPPAMG